MAYPVIEIDPEWVLEQEQLGTKNKYWVRIKGHETLRDNSWLFKYPKKRYEDSDEITGMHWSEKIAYELTKEFKILSPVVELATLDGKIGSLTESFTTEGYSLYHGNQVLTQMHPEYDPNKIQNQNNHKISTIMHSIGGAFVKPSLGEKAQEKFVQYLIFDALICNVDRHHENWGFLRKQLKVGGYRGRLAPSYDHASSLGRELEDKHAENPDKRSCYSLLKDPTGIGRYITGGHGPIYIDGTGRKGPSPMKLVERCLEIPELAPYFTQGLKKIASLNEDKFRVIIDTVPDEHMSELSKDFAYRLLCATFEKLNDLRDQSQ